MLAQAYDAPRGLTETALVELWKEVLGLDQVGVNDPFTALGGASLLSVQLIVRVVRDFGVELSIRPLLQGATVAELAAVIETVQGSADARRAFSVGIPEPDPVGLELGEI